MTKYLHTMIRVSSLDDTIAFFGVLGLREIRRRDDEKGRYTNVFLAAPGDDAAPVELTYNWDSEPYAGGRNFGHLAYAVDNIYDTCNAFVARGVTINRPPRDGRMAFIRTPDGISIELLQAGNALPPAEPWTSMSNTGSWQGGWFRVKSGAERDAFVTGGSDVIPGIGITSALQCAGWRDLVLGADVRSPVGIVEFNAKFAKEREGRKEDSVSTEDTS